MPHVLIKVATGKSEQQKTELAAAIVKNVTDILHCGPEAVSVALEEIEPADWAGKVYAPDILNGPGKLYKEPGYKM